MATKRTTRTWLMILGALWLLFLVAVVVVLVRPGTPPVAANDEAPVLVATVDGWFSPEQVDRGGEVYAQQCAHCHGTNLEGGAAPALSGPQFWDRWEGDTVHSFFEVTRQTMPLDAPGSLDDQAYVDVTGYVMAFNGFPQEAEQDTPPDAEVLEELVIERERAEEAAIAPDGAVAERPPDAEEPPPAEEPEEEPEAEPEAEPDAEALPAPDEQMDDVADPETPAVDEEDEAAVPEAEEDPAEPAEEPDPEQPEPEEPAAEEPAAEEPAEPEVADDRELDEEHGWFTEAQVQAGEAAYAQHCARCHGADLQGFPPLIGGGFPDRFTTVWELYEYVRNTMPLDAPGTLDNQTYADTVAYVLARNGYPMGDERLERDRARMQEMVFAEVDAAEPEQEPAEEEPAEEPEPEEEPAEEPEPEEPAPDEEANDEPNDEPNDQPDDVGAYFTDEQADRGENDYQQHCARCHGDDLRGTQGNPPLVGEDFLAGYQTVHDLFAYTRETMPLDDPGSLDDQTYADITAFILRENDLEAGDEELDADDEDAMQDMPLDDGAAAPDDEARAPDDEAERNQDHAEADAEQAADRAEATDRTEITEARPEGPADDPGDELQADRGRHAYVLHCARCHGETLEGNVAPALGGPVFLERWGGHPVDWLYFQARAAMPPHAPGFLPEQTYADIIVFVLTEAGVLEGFEEFRPHDDDFRALIIRPMAATEERTAVETRVQRLRERVHDPHEDVEVDVEPILPLEWPDDAGAAPIGPAGRVDAPFEVAPGAVDPDAEDDAEDDADPNGEANDEANDEANGEEPADGEQNADDAAEGEANGEAEPAPLAPADPAPDGGPDDDEDDEDDESPMGGGVEVRARAEPVAAVA